MNKKLNDKYEELKPEAFKYEEEITPGFWFGIILSILVMIGFLILFVMFVLTIFSLAGK